MEITKTIIVFGIILVSLVLHELMHGVVAYFLGDDTAKKEGRLTLNPIAHIDPYMTIFVPFLLFLMNAPIIGGAKPVPINKNNIRKGAFGLALVAVAGPLTNLCLAFLLFLVGYFSGGLNDGGMLGYCLTQGIVINLSLMAFNLLPIPPLDGSRVLYLIAPDNVREFLDNVEERIGIFLVLILFICFGDVLSGVVFSLSKQVLEIFYFIVGAR